MTFFKPHPKSDEDTIQAAFIEQCALNSRNIPELALFYHIPNEGKRSIMQAMRMKAIGVKAGVPDLHLPCARAPYCGFWIEFKTAKGKAAPKQLWWHAALLEQGHQVVVCRTVEEAVTATMAYLFPETKS